MKLPTLSRRAVGWLCSGCVLLFVAGYVLWNVCVFDGPLITPGPQTTRVLGPTDEDGYVDFVAVLNEHYGKDVAAEENAVIPLLYALGPNDGDARYVNLVLAELGQPPWQPGGLDFITESEFERMSSGIEWSDEQRQGFYDARERPWTNAEFPLVAQLLERNSEELAAIQKAFKRPNYFRPKLRHPPYNLLSEVHLVRDIFYQFQLRVMRNLGEGQPELAVEDLLCMHRLSRYISAGDVEFQFRPVFEPLVLSTANHWALHSGQTAELIESYRKELSEMRPLPSARKVLDVGTRYQELELLQEVARGRRKAGNFYEVDTTWEWAWRFIPWDGVAERVNALCDQAVSLGELPRAERLQRIWQINGNPRPTSRPGNSFWGFLLGKPAPAPTPWKRVDWSYANFSSAIPAPSVYEVQDRCQTRQQVFDVFLAAVLYRLEHGSYPDSLEALVPEWLLEVPIDVYSGRPVIYRRLGESGMRVYSVGENGIDNGGDSNKFQQDHDDLTFSDPPQQ